MNVNTNEQRIAVAARLVEQSRSGRSVLDPGRFWTDNGEALRDPFAPDCPQMPLGIWMSDECVFDELGVAADWHRLFHEDAYHVELCRRYNERASLVVGRRLVPEHLEGDRNPGAPPLKTLADLFEGRTEWRDESWSYWLHPSANTPAELEALLDRVERRLEHPEEHILPRDFRGGPLALYRHQRGPVTFAMSIYGVENLIYLILDQPDLAARFRDVIVRAILTRAGVIDAAAGCSPQDAPRGWSWADDNCALLDPPMYRFFGLPVLQALFARYAPGAQDRRYQHSDSDMAHLLPVLAEASLTEVNFGPNLTVRQIRHHLPRAVIHGQLAPFTFCRNEEVKMVAETLRDFEQAREHRGVVFATAGSVNAGSRLSGLRLIMETIQTRCRY